jgi:hypothetical protein
MAAPSTIRTVAALATFEWKREANMTTFINSAVVVLQVIGVAAVVYGFALKLYSDVTPVKTNKHLVSGR